MPNVSYTRSELRDYLISYQKVADCLAGEERVKKRGDKYLPRPMSDDDSEQNLARYEAYLTRAVFYNVTRRTLSGFVGSIFETAPVMDLKGPLESLISNCSGDGVGITQLAKLGSANTMGFGRAGLFTDYPHNEQEGPVSKAQIEAGGFAPTIELYDTTEIINWRSRVVNGQDRKTLVVLKEKYISSDDGFEIKWKDQYRVLRLDDSGFYVQEIYRDKAIAVENEKPMQFEPTDANGNRFDYIPFEFIGSETNAADPSAPPMYDIAALNLAHYRNSADYEESCYLVGQPTPYYAGLTEQWVAKVWKNKIIPFGSRAAITLPAGASAGLLQAEANTMPKEAMDAKEKQMVAIGARLVEQSGVQRTATEARMDDSSDRSTLSNVAHNLNAAFKRSLETATRFAGGGTGKFEVNTDLDISNLSAEDQRSVIDAWVKDAISWTEMRNQLRRSGLATEADQKAKDDIEAQAAKDADLLAKTQANIGFGE